MVGCVNECKWMDKLIDVWVDGFEWKVLEWMYVDEQNCAWRICAWSLHSNCIRVSLNLHTPCYKLVLKPFSWHVTWMDMWLVYLCIVCVSFWLVKLIRLGLADLCNNVLLPTWIKTMESDFTQNHFFEKCYSGLINEPFQYFINSDSLNTTKLSLLHYFCKYLNVVFIWTIFYIF